MKVGTCENTYSEYSLLYQEQSSRRLQFFNASLQFNWPTAPLQQDSDSAVHFEKAFFIQHVNYSTRTQRFHRIYAGELYWSTKLTKTAVC